MFAVAMKQLKAVALHLCRSSKLFIAFFPLAEGLTIDYNSLQPLVLTATHLVLYTYKCNKGQNLSDNLDKDDEPLV